MEHSFYPMHDGQMPGTNSVVVLLACFMLHLASVKFGFGHYNISAFFQRFGIESITSVMSGLGSVALAIIMGKHYWLRNKLLKKEMREGRNREKKEEQRDID